ncbi:MAG: hypothetical protein CL933_02080 [Deltaproteobacteria bacterium]|nr:hypothetical protein [Deltaproteobacteria bacterium]
MNDDPRLPDEALGRIDTLVAAIDRVEAAGIDYADTVSLYFLRNFAIDPVEPYLKFHILREGLEPAIRFGGYDTVLQEALDAESDLRQNSPDIIVMAFELATLDESFGTAGWDAAQSMGRLHEMFDAVREHTSSVVIINTMMPALLSADSVTIPEEPIAVEIGRINEWIDNYAASNSDRFVVADWDRLFRLAGRTEAIDQRFWRMSMAPFRGPFLDLYAREIMKVIRALKGKAKKCLVLDCDNTLWGGIVGEEGLGGIRLGESDWPDSAFSAFQRSVLAMEERGVLIALCSKNNPEDVWDVLQNHADCAIKQSHLAAWRVNWDDKASNLVEMAAELNLPLDSFVFVDDSPRECQLVRAALPQVTVLQVPPDLDGYAELLEKDGLFDTLSVSDEDKRRASLYQEERRRSEDRSVHVRVDDYLSSLEQTLRIWEATDADRARVAQLTQKTNQFNLTTKRYSEGQVEEFMRDRSTAVFTMSVGDRYGDLGTTGVLIARRDRGLAEVDTLLLSCRILGRRLEFAFVDRCLVHLEERWGSVRWKSEYRPTRKNAQVVNFWEGVGFSLEGESNGIKTYTRVAGQRVDRYRDVMSIDEAGMNAGSH